MTVPEPQSVELEAASAMVTYGWGMIPVEAGIGSIRWTTSLWPKDGLYILPVKTWVRRTGGLELGDVVTVQLSVDI